MKTKALLTALLGSLAGLGAGPAQLYGQSAEPVGFETPVPSGGSQAGAHRSREGTALGPGIAKPRPAEDIAAPSPRSAAIGTTFPGFGFDDNATENGGFLSIPPDPMGAAGTDRVIAVVNRMIEARSKTGTLLYRDSLRDFFSSLTLFSGSRDFDPKIIYDQYEDRFLVVALELIEAGSNPNPGNISRILLAVSKTGTPASATTADWWFHAINSKTSIGGQDHWADYPGFEVDEDAVYITANMFRHVTRSFGGVRLWIVDKNVVGGFYAGGTPAVSVHDPYAGGGFAVTTMPAQVFGATGVGSGVGTFLVSYSGISTGGPGGIESVQVVRVDNPIGGAPTFTQEFVDIGDIEDVGGIFGTPDLPDAPQSGTGILIEVNDRRALDAVWHDGSLWLTTTIQPNAGQSVGETTAHWFRLDTSGVVDSSSGPGLIAPADQGDIHGEDIVDDLDEVYTFFPSVAVNGSGDAKFGFSASASIMFAGAYVTGREAGDPPGTVQGSETVRAGVDFYIRTFGTPGVDRNRWGDYSGIALDPTDDNLFWVFNEFADVRGTPTGAPTEDGRWGTAWASCSFVKRTVSDFNGDGKSDILWRNGITFNNVVWEMDGFTVTALQSIGGAGSAWKVGGLGDFNGDKKTDVLWRNAGTGNNVVWQMDGFTVSAVQSIGAAGPDWEVAGVGFFDGDNKADILWRNTVTGGNIIWLMDGFTVTAFQSIGGVPLAWAVVGVDDFSGDNKADILWRNTGSGNNIIWQMDGFTVMASQSIGAAGSAWHVAGVGDSNKDNKADIVWRNLGSGATRIWQMDGFTVTGNQFIGSVGSGWTVARLGDYNGDRKADILWRNTGSGGTRIWQMDGFTVTGNQSIGSVPAAWEVQ
ncbi:MAG: VCBS repeat-containing protein [Rhodospirillales bacterium]|nr:VCBS repeat-containing protein [Rhodospirillales bacterium]